MLYMNKYLRGKMFLGGQQECKDSVGNIIPCDEAQPDLITSPATPQPNYWSNQDIFGKTSAPLTPLTPAPPVVDVNQVAQPYQPSTDGGNSNMQRVSKLDDVSQAAKIPQKKKIDPYFAMRGAINGLSWLSGKVDRNRDNQYMDSQYSQFSQKDPVNIYDYQPNKFSQYSRYGGKMSKGLQEDNQMVEYEKGGGIPERYKALGFSSVNSPKKTPGAGKSHAVVIKEDGDYKLIRFGQQGVTGSPKKDGESEAYKNRREAFKARHASNIAKGKSSAAYWADKVKWEEGGMIGDPSRAYDRYSNPDGFKPEFSLNERFYGEGLTPEFKQNRELYNYFNSPVGNPGYNYNGVVSPDDRNIDKPTILQSHITNVNFLEKNQDQYYNHPSQLRNGQTFPQSITYDKDAPLEVSKKGGYINKAGRYVHKDGKTTSRPGLWSNVYMKSKKEAGGELTEEEIQMSSMLRGLKKKNNSQFALGGNTGEECHDNNGNVVPCNKENVKKQSNISLQDFNFTGASKGKCVGTSCGEIAGNLFQKVTGKSKYDYIPTSDSWYLGSNMKKNLADVLYDVPGSNLAYNQVPKVDKNFLEGLPNFSYVTMERGVSHRGATAPKGSGLSEKDNDGADHTGTVINYKGKKMLYHGYNGEYELSEINPDGGVTLDVGVHRPLNYRVKGAYFPKKIKEFNTSVKQKTAVENIQIDDADRISLNDRMTDNDKKWFSVLKDDDIKRLSSETGASVKEVMNAYKYGLGVMNNETGNASNLELGIKENGAKFIEGLGLKNLVRGNTSSTSVGALRMKTKDLSTDTRINGLIKDLNIDLYKVGATKDKPTRDLAMMYIANTLVNKQRLKNNPETQYSEETNTILGNVPIDYANIFQHNKPTTNYKGLNDEGLPSSYYQKTFDKDYTNNALDYINGKVTLDPEMQKILDDKAEAVVRKEKRGVNTAIKKIDKDSKNANVQNDLRLLEAKKKLMNTNTQTDNGPTLLGDIAGKYKPVVKNTEDVNNILRYKLGGRTKNKLLRGK